MASRNSEPAAQEFSKAYLGYCKSEANYNLPELAAGLRRHAKPHPELAGKSLFRGGVIKKPETFSFLEKIVREGTEEQKAELGVQVLMKDSYLSNKAGKAGFCSATTVSVIAQSFAEERKEQYDRQSQSSQSLEAIIEIQITTDKSNVVKAFAPSHNLGNLHEITLPDNNVYKVCSAKKLRDQTILIGISASER